MTNNYHNSAKDLENEVLLLREEVALYKSLVDSTDIAIMKLKDNRFIDCNKKAEELFKLTSNQIIGKHLGELSPKYQPNGELSIELAKKNISKIYVNNSISYEWVNTRGDNTRFFAQIYLTKVAVSETEYVQVIIRDISEEKISKERIETQNRLIRELNNEYKKQNNNYKNLVAKLKNQQDFTQTVLDSINEGVAIFYKKSFTYLNNSVCELLNINKYETSTSELFHKLGTNINAIELPEQDEKYETWTQGEDNNKYFHVIIIPQIESGLYMAQITDLTEIRNTNQKVIENEYKFRTIFHYSSQSILIISDNYDILEVNDTFTKTFNFEAKYIVSRPLISLFNNYETVIEQLNKDNNTDNELLLHNNKGQKYTIKLSQRRVQIGSSHIYLLFLTDISEHKNYEQQIFSKIIKKQESEKQWLAANIHDELGPLLSSINLYNNTLIESKDESIVCIAKQINNLLKESFSTIRLLNNNLKSVILNKKGLSEAIKKQLYKVSDFFEIDYYSTIGALRFESDIEINLFRIISELIHNTLKHSNGTTIKTHLSIIDNYLVCSYSDNGIGYNFHKIILNSKGHGLSNIIARIKALNAEYNFQSFDNSGFNIEIKIAYKEINARLD